MSYCHNIFGGTGYRQSRYLFGKAGEASFKQLANFHTGLESSTPDGTITVGSNLPCLPGQTASVAGTGTYQWAITGGVIVGSSTNQSVTFTPTSANVTLTVTVTSAKGCGITTSKTTTTQCAAIAPP